MVFVVISGRTIDEKTFLLFSNVATMIVNLLLYEKREGGINESLYIPLHHRNTILTALGNTEENIMHKVADALMPMLKESGIDALRGQKPTA